MKLLELPECRLMLSWGTPCTPIWLPILLPLLNMATEGLTTLQPTTLAIAIFPVDVLSEMSEFLLSLFSSDLCSMFEYLQMCIFLDIELRKIWL